MCFAFAKPVLSQVKAAPSKNKLVELIEEKQPKRWNLYAQNNTDQEQEAFLMVQGEGFRRSADRPVIKKIPPKDKVLMITLIPLKGMDPVYETVFTYETNLQTLQKRKGENKEEHVNIRPLREDELTIFTEDDCEKCTYLINHLNKNHIKYRSLEVFKNGKVFDFMWENIKGKVPQSDVITLPVVLDKGKVYHNIVNIKRFTETYARKKPKG